jgi:ADP-ribose pyrophosphatase
MTGRIDTRSVFRGRVVNLSVDQVRLPNGHETELEMIRHPGAAVALPLELDADGVERALLIRQYRYAANGWLLEVPGGKLDGDEDPETCIVRELEEEIGYRAGSLEPLGWIWTTPGYTDERIWLYVARDLQALDHGSSLEEDEVLELERLPLTEAVTRAIDGDITDAKTVATLLRAAARLGISTGDT